MMVEDTKEKVLNMFQGIYPEEISIKEAAKKAELTRETTSKYVSILEAEGKIFLTRKVGNAKFFRAKPDIYTQTKIVRRELKSLFSGGFNLEVYLGEDEIKLLQEAQKILEKDKVVKNK